MDEKSLEAIFATDPIDLTDAEVDRIVEYFQGKRQLFLASPEAKGEKRKKADAAPDLKIEDLGL